jgi:hypothetical protein
MISQSSTRVTLRRKNQSSNIFIPVQSSSRFLVAILDYCRNEESVFVSMVCKQWNASVKKFRCSMGDLFHYYCILGNLALKYISLYYNAVVKFPKTFSNRFSRTTYCATAAENGHLEVLQWLRQIGCKWDDRTCGSAERNGHFTVKVAKRKFWRQNMVNWKCCNGPGRMAAIGLNDM